MIFSHKAASIMTVIVLKKQDAPRNRSRLKRKCFRKFLQQRLPLIMIAFLILAVAIRSFCCLYNHKYADPRIDPYSPRKFEPLVPDSRGTPNVVYGCAASQQQQQQRQVDGIQLHVIGWRRAQSLQTLLRQLEHANYQGWDDPVSLHIHIDGGASQAVLDLVQPPLHNTSQRLWTHGPVSVRVADENVGLRVMWFDSLGPAAKQAGNNTLLITFEDDTRVSPAYFQWILANIDAYGQTPACRDANLVGFSLSPILLQELEKPFYRWDARKAMGSRFDNENRHSSYLTVVPSSWGAAYWSNIWQEFDAFARFRMQEPFYHDSNEESSISDYSQLQLTPGYLYVPRARSNVWPKSWKRFMVDFMYARGYVMMYPCLPQQRGLATALQENGEHVVQSTNKNARVADLVREAELDWPNMGTLPPYGELAVFDLFLQTSTKEEVARDGAKFMDSVYQKCQVGPSLCQQLIDLWARPNWKPNQDPTSNPGICVPDLYTSAKAWQDRPAPPTASDEKYLLFEPQYGANNQLHAVVEAYYWARVLERRLVLPPLFLPRVSAYAEVDQAALTEGLPMKDFLYISDIDLPTLFSGTKVSFPNQALEPIGFAAFLELSINRPWRIIRTNREASFDKATSTLLKAFAWDDDEEDPAVPVVNLRHLHSKTLTMNTVRHHYSGCDDQVLAFDGMFFNNIEGINPRELMPDVISMSPSTKQVYDIVKNKLEEKLGTDNYACYHVRLGDFATMCDVLENPERNLEVSKHLPSSYLRTAQEFACAVSPDELRVALVKNGYPSLIMSDSPDQLVEALSDSNIKYVTSTWVTETVLEVLQQRQQEQLFAPPTTTHALQLYSLIVDQELCSHAQYAVLNRFSTVSQRVISLRRGSKFDYWTR